MKQQDRRTRADSRGLDGLAGRVSTGLRIVLAVIAGLVLMLGALLLGIALGAVVLLWKVLGERRRSAASSGWRPSGTSRQQAVQIDVIDIEAHEVAVAGRHGSQKH
jgi:hypothetical protein